MRVREIVTAQCVVLLSLCYLHVTASRKDISTEWSFDLLPIKPPQWHEDENDDDNYEPEDEDNWSEKCQLTPKEGFCGANIKRYYYNADLGRCMTFIYGGCFGNKNNFKTYHECLKRCDGINKPSKVRKPYCYLSPKKGLCNAYLPRYYFNWKKGKCEEFIYGGCGANRNNFLTLTECKDKCVDGITELE